MMPRLSLPNRNIAIDRLQLGESHERPPEHHFTSLGQVPAVSVSSRHLAPSIAYRICIKKISNIYIKTVTNIVCYLYNILVRQKKDIQLQCYLQLYK